MRKLLTTTLGVLLASGAMAQTTATNTSTATTTGLYERLKESPLDLMVETFNESTRDGVTNEVNGFAGYLAGYFSYGLPNGGRVYVTPSLSYQNNDTTNAYLDWIYYRYKQGILNEKTDPISLSVSARYYDTFRSSDNPGNQDRHGLWRFDVIASKTVNKYFSIDVEGRFYKYHIREGFKEGATRDTFRSIALIPTVSLPAGTSIGLYTRLGQTSFYDQDPTKALLVNPTFSFTINQNVSGWIETSFNYLADQTDAAGNVTADLVKNDDWNKNMPIGVGIDISAF